MAYFDLRGITNGGYKKGDDWIGEAARVAQTFGFETVVDNNPGTFPPGFPMSQIALYAGWYDWNASGPFARPPVEFMPGAFAYHLQSYSAASLRTTNRYWCVPLLAEGAAATMGCVDEPFLDCTPDVGVFFARWMLLGFTFGEAAYAAQSTLSWQTTVVGDPLYRPFNDTPSVRHQELLARGSKLIEWSDLQWVDMNLASGGSKADFAKYLENERPTAHSAVLTEKLGDLYDALGKERAAISAYERALKLNPTPEQNVRLTLKLGDKLAAEGKQSEALKLYDAFLKRLPDYPDAVSLYRKMEAIARHLGKEYEAMVYAGQIRRLTMSQ
jgi:tetratricopeptide (TPR) repeat protein